MTTREREVVMAVPVRCRLRLHDTFRIRADPQAPASTDPRLRRITAGRKREVVRM